MRLTAPDKPGFWWHFGPHGGTPQVYRVSLIDGRLMVYFYIPQDATQPFVSRAIPPFVGEWEPVAPARMGEED